MVNDKFLDVMLEQMESCMQIEKRERFFQEVAEKPKYVSMTYVERDVNEASFLNGAPQGVEGILKEQAADIRVLFGRASFGYGTSNTPLCRIPRSSSSLRWAFIHNIEKAVDEAFKDFGMRASEASMKKSKRDKERMMTHLSRNEVDPPYIEKRKRLPSLPKNLKRCLQRWTKHVDLENIYVHDVEADVSASRVFRRFVDSQGRIIRDNRISKGVILNIRFEHENGEIMEWYRSLESHTWRGMERKVAEFFEEAEEELEIMRTASVLESGSYPTILTPEASATTIHEVLTGHNASGEEWKNGGNTVWSGKKGKRVVPINLNVTDEPLAPGEPERIVYDDEGIRSVPVDVLLEGKLNAALHNRSSAGFYNVASNGHGRREWPEYDGESLVCQPRLMNGRIWSDEAMSYQGLLDYAFDYARRKDKKFILVLQSFEGLTDSGWDAGDQASGRIETRPDLAYKLFPDGSREYVAFFYATDTPYEVCKRIKAAADDFKTTYKICGDRSGDVNTSESAPSLFVESLNVQSTLPDDED